MRKTAYRPRGPRATMGLTNKTKRTLGDGAGVLIGAALMYVGIRGYQEPNQSTFEHLVAAGIGVTGAVFAASIILGKSIV